MIPAEKWQSPHVVFLHSCILSHPQAPQQCGQIGICIPWSGKTGIKPRLGHCWHTSPFWAATENLRKPRTLLLLPPGWRGGWQQWPRLGRVPHLLSAGCRPPAHPSSLSAQIAALVTRVSRAQQWGPGLFTDTRLFIAFGNWLLGQCLELTLGRAACRLLVALQVVDTCLRSSRAFRVTSFHYDLCQHR